MCDFCEINKFLLTKEVPDVVFEKYIDDLTLAIIVDRGYLRLVNTDDYECIDHGEKIKINFCPMCGKKL
jgi:hypothetical protein